MLFYPFFSRSFSITIFEYMGWMGKEEGALHIVLIFHIHIILAEKKSPLEKEYFLSIKEIFFRKRNICCPSKISPSWNEYFFYQKHILFFNQIFFIKRNIHLINKISSILRHIHVQRNLQHKNYIIFVTNILLFSKRSPSQKGNIRLLKNLIRKK